MKSSTTPRRSLLAGRLVCLTLSLPTSGTSPLSLPLSLSPLFPLSPLSSLPFLLSPPTHTISSPSDVSSRELVVKNKMLGFQNFDFNAIRVFIYYLFITCYLLFIYYLLFVFYYLYFIIYLLFSIHLQKQTKNKRKKEERKQNK